MVAQGVLLLGVLVLAVIFRGGGFGTAAVGSGAGLLLISAGVAVAGTIALGTNLTPFPKPGDQAQLVCHGIYALIRHPLYASVIAGSLGWALVWQSWPALAVAGALMVFFHAKARCEERWLRQRFPEYAAYQRQVRRFIPWLW